MPRIALIFDIRFRTTSSIHSKSLILIVRTRRCFLRGVSKTCFSRVNRKERRMFFPAPTNFGGTILNKNFQSFARYFWIHFSYVQTEMFLRFTTSTHVYSMNNINCKKEKKKKMGLIRFYTHTLNTTRVSESFDNSTYLHPRIILLIIIAHLYCITNSIRGVGGVDHGLKESLIHNTHTHSYIYKKKSKRVQ